MIERVRLYRAPSTVAAVDEIADWVTDRLANDGDDRTPDVTVESRFLETHRTPALAEQFAAARVRSPYDRETGNTMVGTVRYEERALEDPEREGGVLYDGEKIQRALNAALPSEETDLSTAHVIVLDRALGTWGRHDGRWHKRVNVLGQPTLISVPGLYEAPAKPEAYYKAKQKHAMLAGDAPPREVLENQVEGDFLVENDPRTTDALKGYVLQALHYLETGSAFCDDDSCRLYNAHHHEELVTAQLQGTQFCSKHAARYR
ncbi:hypothetical protein C479_02846 [Halovivax asiaticus JCM 14624]|uniref:Uncharacterized protein n=1 Tax=Halovivax asiaticus JCM 14624 TaxID=1227490 RepID=M0BTM3_9EURY|nr:DUF6775 family putative metallopeptidase [Halovivax asiaticus]ELZ13748.1 hypothetical protein C479_02846 [Halovivax asiaticus JCM 14624]